MTVKQLHIKEWKNEHIHSKSEESNKISVISVTRKIQLQMNIGQINPATAPVKQVRGPNLIISLSTICNRFLVRIRVRGLLYCERLVLKHFG